MVDSGWRLVEVGWTVEYTVLHWLLLELDELLALLLEPTELFTVEVDDGTRVKVEVTVVNSTSVVAGGVE
jgi:hypothetical protein